MAPGSKSSSSAQKTARESLACLPCRRSKRACDGQSPFASASSSKRGVGSTDSSSEAILSENPCSRCAKSKTECLWLPSRRFGRPRAPIQKNASSDLTPNSSTLNDTSISTTLDQTTSSKGVGDPVFTFDSLPKQNHDQFDFLDSTFAIAGGNAFSDQASLLAQNASLDQELEAGALDECLYGMWGSEDYNKWRNAGAASSSSGNALSSNSPSSPSSHYSTSHNINSVDPSSSTANQTSDNASSPVRASAKDQFNQLLEALAPPPQPQSQSQTQDQAHLSPQETLISASSSQVLAVPDHLRSGCESFFDLAAQFCSILGNASQFYTSSSTQDLLLLNSMAALGAHLSRASFNPYLEESRRLADEVVAGQRSLTLMDSVEKGACHARSTLSLVQALVIQTFMEYGLAQEDRAARLLKKAVTLAFEAGLHQIDQPLNFASGSSFLPLQSLCTTETHGGEDGSKRWLAESLRRTFWEIVLMDIMMFCASSGKVGGYIEKNQPGIHVNFSADPGEELLPNPRRDICSMKIRAATLLLESISPLESNGGAFEDRARNSLAHSRVYSMDIMISNLTVSAHHSFVRAVKVNVHSESSDMEVVRTNRARVESHFVTLLMLNCARVHLHRMYALPNMNLELTTCSFNPVEAAPTFLERSKLASSLEKIVQASESIMSLTRTDYYLHSNLSDGLGPLDIGDEMEELRGLKNRSRNSLLFEKKANFLSPLFAHQPAFACAQLTACWSLVCSIAALRQNIFVPQNSLPISDAAQAELRESVLWKQRRAISNITFAENNLEILFDLWPIAGLMLEEVRRCRDTVDSGGLV